MRVHQLTTLLIVELVLNVVDGQFGGTDGLAHAIAGHARIRSKRIGAAQLVDIARF